MKTCRACGQEKPQDQFNWKYKSKGVRCATCRDCMRLYIRKHYENNTAYYIEKAMRRKKIYKRDTYKMLFEYFNSHPCVDCGESDPVVLEFDHVRNAPKIGAVSDMVKRQMAWDTIMKEIAKCEVRGANCHRRRTAKQLGYYLYLAEA